MHIRLPATSATAVALAFAAAPVAAQEDAFVHRVDDAALDWAGCPPFMPDGCEIAVLRGDPAEPHADIFFRVPGGAEIARHWHTSPERMVLVTGEMRVDYDDQEPATMATGAYGYGPAGKPHSAVCLSEEPCTLFIAFVDPVDATAGAPD